MRIAFTRIDDSLRPRVPRTNHGVGLPPELTDGIDRTSPLPPADVFVIVQAKPITDPDARRILDKLSARAIKAESYSDEPGWLLYRLTLEGVDAGDTWHRTMDHAKDQAHFEYGEAVGEWREAELEAPDARDYVLDQLSGTS